MEIQGIQKTTLLDYPGKVACTIFTKGCNFKCPFCHNASLVTHINEKPVMTEGQFFDFMDRRKGILDGVCISGGEPMLQSDLESLMRTIKKRGFLVKLDTNGTYPERLKAMIDEHLVDYVAMDIKNSRERYLETAGLDLQKETAQSFLERIQRSVSILMETKVPYEFRTTVTRQFHGEEEFREIREWLSGASDYYLQAFVDSGDLINPKISGVSKEEMKRYLELIRVKIPNASLRGMDETG